MKRFLKKALVGTLAALMLASSVIAANGEMDNMVFVGYDVAMYDDVAITGEDTTIAPDWQNPHKVYKEVIDGKDTGKVVLVPVKPDWQFEGFEAKYPYAGYYRLYLEGNKQEITDYKGNADQNEGYVFPLWQTKRSDYMWEISYPYTVYERQQTLVNDTTWTWDFGNDAWGILDSAVLVPTNKKAVITNVAWNKYGFGQYDNEGNYLTDAEEAMYNYFNVGNANITFEEMGLTTAALSARDSKNVYVLSDAEIAAMIPVVYSKNITGKFTNANDDGLETKDVAASWLAASTYAKYNWNWDNGQAVFTCDRGNTNCHTAHFKYEKTNNPCDWLGCLCGEKLANEKAPYTFFNLSANAYESHKVASFYVDKTVATIDWSPVYYELAAPYRQYQYLIVNGVALDGSKIGEEKGVDIYRERVFRYTGGNATPKIEWRFARYEECDKPCQRCGAFHYYVEQRYVDGVPEVDFYGNAVYRTSECKHEHSYQTPEGVRGTVATLGTYSNYSLTGNYFNGFAK